MYTANYIEMAAFAIETVLKSGHFNRDSQYIIDIEVNIILTLMLTLMFPGVGTHSPQSPAHQRCCRAPIHRWTAKFIILNTKLLVLNTKFIIFNKKFLVFNKNIIVFTHEGDLLARYSRHELAPAKCIILIQNSSFLAYNSSFFNTNSSSFRTCGAGSCQRVALWPGRCCQARSPAS